MTRARRIGCGSDRVADGGTPEVSESRGRGVANGEKPSGGARETRLKSRIDRSAGGRRGDDATIGRQPARDIVDTADGVARDRPGNRESVAPRGQGGASGRHFFCQRNLGPTPRLRVGLQSTLGLSPDSSVAIDCQNVSPEPGAFDDTAGPARRVCARPRLRDVSLDRLSLVSSGNDYQTGSGSVTFGHVWSFFLSEKSRV